jgi:hypothetical protein
LGFFLSEECGWMDGHRRVDLQWSSVAPKVHHEEGKGKPDLDLTEPLSLYRLRPRCDWHEVTALGVWMFGVWLAVKGKGRSGRKRSAAF